MLREGNRTEPCLGLLEREPLLLHQLLALSPAILAGPMVSVKDTLVMLGEVLQVRVELPVRDFVLQRDPLREDAALRHHPDAGLWLLVKRYDALVDGRLCSVQAVQSRVLPGGGGPRGSGGLGVVSPPPPPLYPLMDRLQNLDQDVKGQDVVRVEDGVRVLDGRVRGPAQHREQVRAEVLAIGLAVEVREEVLEEPRDSGKVEQALDKRLADLVGDESLLPVQGAGVDPREEDLLLRPQARPHACVRVEKVDDPQREAEDERVSRRSAGGGEEVADVVLDPVDQPPIVPDRS
mmetsp:Transcript_10857/g.26592  ORF Transcript_10857/g.26592 Transcript_10857/m.26592 type:complete len:292 (+) Transcript_10857:911-1786(+)